MDFSSLEPPTELGRYRILSPKCGLRVSPLQLGSMSIGDAWSSFMGRMNKEQAFEPVPYTQRTLPTKRIR
ncbi:putative aryl-alcohol dehydrogenase AAD14, partial [Fusarium kuroshium]